MQEIRIINIKRYQLKTLKEILKKEYRQAMIINLDKLINENTTDIFIDMIEIEACSGTAKKCLSCGNKQSCDEDFLHVDAKDFIEKNEKNLYLFSKDETKLKWKCDIMGLLKELLENNPTAWACTKPIRILQSILAELSKRAIELNDLELNKIMMRLSLYSVSSPGDKEFNQEIVNEYLERKK